MQVLRRGVTHRPVELRRCVAAGWVAGGRVDFTCVAAACLRGGSRHLRFAGNFAQNSGRWRRFARAASSTTLHFASLIGSC